MLKTTFIVIFYEISEYSVNGTQQQQRHCVDNATLFKLSQKKKNWLAIGFFYYSFQLTDDFMSCFGIAGKMIDDNRW